MVETKLAKLIRTVLDVSLGVETMESVTDYARKKQVQVVVDQIMETTMSSSLAFK